MAQNAEINLVNPYDSADFVPSAPTPEVVDPSAPVLNIPKYGKDIPQTKISSAENNYKDLLPGFGKAFHDYGLRMDQVGGVQGSQDTIDSYANLDKDLMNSGWGMAGNILGNVATTGAGVALGARIPGVGPTMVRAGLSSPYLTNALISAGLGATMPVKSDDSTLGNMAEGAIGGTLGMGGLNTLGKLISTVGPPVIGGVSKWSDKSAKQLYDFMRSKGLSMGAGDIGDNAGTRWAENLATRLPLSGRGAWLENTLDDIKKVGANLGSSLGIPNMHDANAAIVSSIKQAYKTAKTTAGSMYDDVATAVSANPNAPTVVLPTTHQAIIDAQKVLPDVWDKLQNTQAKNIIEKLSAATNQKSVLIDPITKKPFVKMPELSFTDARVARKILRNAKEQAFKLAENGTMSSDEAHGLAGVYKAFNEDLDNWGLNPTNTGIFEKYQAANNFHKSKVVPFTEPTMLQSNSPVFKQIIADKKNPDLVDSLVFKKGQPSIVDDLLNLTGANRKSVNAMRSIVMDKIIGNSSTTNAPQQTIAENFNKFGDLAERVLTPAQFANLNRTVVGLSKMSPRRHSENVLNALENSPVKSLMGSGELAGMGALSLYGHPGLAAGLAAVTAGGGRLIHHMTTARPFVNYRMSDPTIMNPAVNKLGGLGAAAYSQQMEPDISANVVGRLGPQ